MSHDFDHRHTAFIPTNPDQVGTAPPREWLNTHVLTIKATDGTETTALTADLLVRPNDQDAVMEAANKVLDEHGWRRFTDWFITDDKTTLFAHLEQRVRSTVYERVDIYAYAPDPEIEIVVRKFAGHDEYRVEIEGDVYDVWLVGLDGGGEGLAPGWWTEVGGEKMGPFGEAKKLIEDVFLNDQ